MNALPLPDGVADTDDVAVLHVTEHAQVHRPGIGVTGCGLPMWAMQHPLPSAGYLAALSPQWCEHARCFPRVSAWDGLLRTAYQEPARPLTQSRDVFPAVNRAHRGLLARLHLGGRA